MNRADLPELHYITPIANLASIVQHGIASHRVAARIRHESVAMAEIQERQTRVVVPGGRPLHDYINLYLCARNPMMYRRKEDHATLCVLRVSTAVLDLSGVVITDGNAAANLTRFMPSPQGLAELERDLVFATYWTDPDYYEQIRKKRAKCAEVLIPETVQPEFILGAYVSSRESLLLCQDAAPGLALTLNAQMYFR